MDRRLAYAATVAALLLLTTMNVALASDGNTTVHTSPTNHTRANSDTSADASANTNGNGAGNAGGISSGVANANGEDTYNGANGHFPDGDPYMDSDVGEVTGFDQGIVVGVQGGVARFDYRRRDFGLNAQAIDNHVASGRAYLGYALNDFFSGEVGYTHYSNVKFKRIVGTPQTEKVRHRAVDLVAKVTLPFESGFSLYLKIGPTYVKRDKIVVNGVLFKRSSDRFTGLGGVGWAYNFTPGFAVDVAWTRTFKSGDIDYIDLYTGGVSYKFIV